MDANDLKWLLYPKSHFCVSWLQYPKSTQLEPKPITRNEVRTGWSEIPVSLAQKGINIWPRSVWNIQEVDSAWLCMGFNKSFRRIKQLLYGNNSGKGRQILFARNFVSHPTSSHARERTRKARKQTLNWCPLVAVERMPGQDKYWTVTWVWQELNGNLGLIPLCLFKKQKRKISFEQLVLFLVICYLAHRWQSQAWRYWYSPLLRPMRPPALNKAHFPSCGEVLCLPSENIDLFNRKWRNDPKCLNFLEIEDNKNRSDKANKPLMQAGNVSTWLEQADRDDGMMGMTFLRRGHSQQLWTHPTWDSLRPGSVRMKFGDWKSCGWY